jgi:Mn-dependent DtxR family transcriptional regulator
MNESWALARAGDHLGALLVLWEAQHGPVGSVAQCRAAARDLGVSERTVWRAVARLRRPGLAA